MFKRIFLIKWRNCYIFLYNVKLFLTSILIFKFIEFILLEFSLLSCFLVFTCTYHHKNLIVIMWFHILDSLRWKIKNCCAVIIRINRNNIIMYTKLFQSMLKFNYNKREYSMKQSRSFWGATPTECFSM